MISDYYQKIRPELLERVPPDARRVLDLGCGAGALGKALKDRYGCYVAGVEAVPEAAEAARQVLDRVVAGNLEEEFPFKDEEFDCVICGDVLEHLTDPWSICRQICRVLSDNGTFLASIPNAANIRIISELLRGDFRYRDEGLMDITHLRFFTLRSIREMLHFAGFVIEDMVSSKEISRYDASTQRPSEIQIEDFKIDVSQIPADLFDQYFVVQYILTARKRPRDVPDVIVVAQNGRSMTRKCLDSVRDHTQVPYRLVLVDNGSADGTGRIFEAVAGAPVLQLENVPFSEAISSAVITGRSKFGLNSPSEIVLLHNDVIVGPGWLECLLEALRSDPAVACAGAKAFRADGGQRYDSAFKEGKPFEEIRRAREQQKGQLSETDTLQSFCVAIDRAAWEEAGGFGPSSSFPSFAMEDLCLRFKEMGKKSVVAESVLVHHLGERTFRETGVSLADLWEQDDRAFKARWEISAVERSDYCHPRSKAAREARKLFQEERFLEAARVLSEWLKVDAVDDLCYNDLGTVMHALGRPGDAIKYFSAAIRINSGLEEARSNLVALARTNPEFEEEVTGLLLSVSGMRGQIR